MFVIGGGNIWRNAGRAAVVLVVSLVLAGCLPVTSKTPVGTTAGLGADRALMGTWKGPSLLDEKHQDAFFHFMAAKDGALTAAVILAKGSPDDGWTIFNVRSATLGANKYLNAVETFDKDAPAEGDLKNANIPLLYVVKGRTLTIYLIDEDKAKAAVKAGTLKGTIEAGDSGDVQLTADADELDAFFAKPESAQLFKAMFVLKRVD